MDSDLQSSLESHSLWLTLCIILKYVANCVLLNICTFIRDSEKVQENKARN